MNLKIVFLLALVSPRCVSSVPFAHIRKRRVSANEFGVDMDENLDGHDDGYTAYGNYDDYEFETFVCSVGQEKIPLELLCDGITDCSDGSDEVPSNCQEHTDSTVAPSPSMTTPLTSTTVKLTTQQLVEPELRKIVDYDDYTDCTVEEIQCTSDPSICLPKYQLCDGIDDCPEKEDELGCLVEPPSTNYESARLDSESTFLKKAREEYSEYSPSLGDRDNRTRDSFSTAKETTLKSGSLRPNILFKKRPPTQEIVPILIARMKKERDQELALEADYQYMNYDGQEALNAPLDNMQQTGVTHQNSKSNQTRPGYFEPVILSEDHEIEINHATGEITLIKNGLREILLPTITTGTLKPKLAAEPQHENGIITNSLTNSPSDSQQVNDRKYTEHRKQLRGIVGKLLQHIGVLIEDSELVEHADDSLHPDINVAVNLDDTFPEHSIYSRTSRGKKALVRVNLEFHL